MNAKEREENNSDRTGTSVARKVVGFWEQEERKRALCGENSARLCASGTESEL